MIFGKLYTKATTECCTLTSFTVYSQLFSPLFDQFTARCKKAKKSTILKKKEKAELDFPVNCLCHHIYVAEQQ